MNALTERIMKIFMMMILLKYRNDIAHNMIACFVYYCVLTAIVRSREKKVTLTFGIKGTCSRFVHAGCGYMLNLKFEFMFEFQRQQLKDMFQYQSSYYLEVKKH